MEKRPFEDVNILDFTWTATGPFTLNPLAFYGANIIKVESRERYDALRALGPFKDGVAGPESSYYFTYSQIGKRNNITLNMDHPKAADIARKLVKWADVVADSYATGTKEKWGLDYENLKKIKEDNPKFTVQQVTAMAEDDPPELEPFKKELHDMQMELIDLEEECNSARNMLRAMDDRKDALEHEVSLWKGNYFATPRESRETAAGKIMDKEVQGQRTETQRKGTNRSRRRE